MYLFAGVFSHKTPGYSLVDTTQPVFDGIVSLTPQINGSLRAAWAAATDTTIPVRYRIYCQAGSATGIVSPGNIVAEVNNLQFDIFQLQNNTLLQKNITYYVRVHAIDAVGVINSSVVTLSAVSAGILEDTLMTLAQMLDNIADQTAATAAALEATNDDFVTNVNDLQNLEATLDSDIDDLEASILNIQNIENSLDDAVSGLQRADITLAVAEDESQISITVQDGDEE